MKDTILSIIRHALTFGGGFIASKGILSEDTTQSVVAGLVTFIGLIWGAVDEYLASKKAV